MKFTTLASTLALCHTTVAYPGMAQTLQDIQRRAGLDAGDSFELIGDLVNTPDNSLSAVGKDVKSIILGGNGQSTDTWRYSVPAKGSTACQKDTCCIWQYISNDMKSTFTGAAGRCNALARGAIRLGFHDAAGWSKNTGTGGGADGSIILAPAEMTRPENNGLQEIVAQMQTWYNNYKAYGVSMADLIQMGATVATVVCPLGPRIKSYVGRKDSSAACTDGLLPGVNQPADALIKLFQDKTIQPNGLVALIGAHTTSQQRFVNTTRALDPQDSTPGVWDVLFYTQTITTAPVRVFKFASDIVLSQDPRTASEFKEFAKTNGGNDWNEYYAREYVRLSMLGVYNINSLTDCSKVLPSRTSYYYAPDQAYLTKWMGTSGRSSGSDTISQALRSGSSIANLASSIISSILGKIFG
ncbi:heme peroxidase [Thozetella sp. PMI_491]|nr:heme peroxidase [Thozetella sp. PMI_491]